MKKLLISLAAAATAFLFTSCFDPIFQSIRAEVALEDADIAGFVNSMVPYSCDKDGDGAKEDYLFVQNGNIYYKLATNTSHGSWTKEGSSGIPDSVSYSYYDNEFKGWSFIKLASDKQYLYALCYQPEFDEDNNRNVPKNVKLYVFDGSSWKEASKINAAISAYISKLDKDNYMMDASIHLFDNGESEYAGSGDDQHQKITSNRKAYIRIGGGSPYETGETPNLDTSYGDTTKGNYGVILLNGAGTEATAITKGTNGAGTYTLSAVNVGGTDYFTDYVATIKSKNNSSYFYMGIGSALYTFPTSALSETISVIKDSSTETMYLLDAYYQGKKYYTDAAKTTTATVSLDAMTVEGTSKAAIYTKKTTGCSDSILSLAETSDYILMGTYEYGVYHAALSAGIPADATSSFTTNADDIMCSPYIIRMLYVVNPAVTEGNATAYSSMQFRYTASSAGTSYSNTGLWSYYKVRGNWNRE